MSPLRAAGVGLDEVWRISSNPAHSMILSCQRKQCPVATIGTGSFVATSTGVGSTLSVLRSHLRQVGLEHTFPSGSGGDVVRAAADFSVLSLQV